MVSHHPPLTRRLVGATLLLGGLTAINPLVVRWSYKDWNQLLVVVAIAPTLPLLAFAGATLWQERAGKSTTMFAPRALSTVMFLMSSWVLGVALLGYFVLVLGLVVLPVSASLLAAAWVQPRPEHVTLTVVLAVVAVPFVVWFAGRADEYPWEALYSGAVLISIVVLMTLMRRSGNRRQDRSTGPGSAGPRGER